MLKWLILFGGGYLAYRAAARALGGVFVRREAEVNDSQQAKQAKPYTDEDVVDVHYRDVKRDDRTVDDDNGSDEAGR